MKRINTIVLSLFVFCCSYAQKTMSYDSNLGKISFKVLEDEFYYKFSDKDMSIVEKKYSNFQKVDDNSGILQNEINKYQKKEPILIYNDGTKQIVDGRINIKVKSNIDIKKLVSKWNFNIEKSEIFDNVYLLKSNYSTEKIFSIVNELQKNNNVIFVEPNFMRFVIKNKDFSYSEDKWSLNSEYGIKVKEAWKYATGRGIKVAVLDEGVDLNHPDLKENLLGGYDATDRGYSRGAPDRNDSHGTACAGIIAGKTNNSLGMKGIAYEAKIIPVRIAYKIINNEGRYKWKTNDTWIAKGIKWAYKKAKADILSNSWSGGSRSNLIKQAIDEATQEGRNKNGTVVIFSSGNGEKSRNSDGNDPVNFPSKLDNVIAVGASTMCGERKSFKSCDGEDNWGSNYGPELDLVAPGVNIFTTDISGERGYSRGDYAYGFNGTSAACPHVAGVVALILSVNNNLTYKEVQDILERTADKIRPDLYNYESLPNGKWNQEVGYGLVNATKAVKAVLKQDISGKDILCSRNRVTYSLEYSDDVIWEVENANIERQNNKSITITPQMTSSLVTVTARFSDGKDPISKKIWIGEPKLDYLVEKIVGGYTYPETNILGGLQYVMPGSRTYYWYRLKSLINNSFNEVIGVTSLSCFKENKNGWEKTYTPLERCDGEVYEGNEIGIKVVATNDCGVFEKVFSIPDPFDSGIDIFSLSHNRFKVVSNNSSINNGYSTFSRSVRENGEIKNYKLIRVFDMMNMEVFSTSKTEFDLSILPKGIYYAVVIDLNDNVVAKKTIRIE